MDRIPVFYRPEAVANVASFSPSAGKPAAVMADWIGVDAPIDIHSFAPLAPRDLYRVHDSAFVDGILSGACANGFGNRDTSVARACLFTTGAMAAAAREAVSNREVAVAPVSGFHHAGHASAGGFCTFNGLMAAAFVLRDEGIERVGILDLDQHFGDGTQDIIDMLDVTWVQHYTGGRYGFQAVHAEEFLRELPDIVQGFRGCDVLLYQAGADPHIDDPLGGWLTTAQLLKRDQIVFRVARQLRLPIAWNLAGGYQRDDRGGIAPVLAIHRNTMRACMQTYCVTHRECGAGARAGAVRRAIKPVQIQGEVA